MVRSRRKRVPDLDVAVCAVFLTKEFGSPKFFIWRVLQDVSKTPPKPTQTLVRVNRLCCEKKSVMKRAGRVRMKFVML